jgi:riboflavin kinase/FMN adenylyltransferase
VEFLLKLRDEKKFGSFDELRTQIQRDAVAARQYLQIPADR